MEVPSRAGGIEHGRMTLRRIVRMLNHRTKLTAKGGVEHVKRTLKRIVMLDLHAEAQERSGVRHGLRTLSRIVHMPDHRGAEDHRASVTALRVGVIRESVRFWD